MVHDIAERTGGGGVAVRTSLLRMEGTFDPASLRVEGEVDLSTSEVFATTLGTMVERGAGDVRVDVQGLDFIDVAGLRALAAAACRLGLQDRRLVLLSVAPHLIRLMDLVGWSDIPALSMIPADHGLRNRRGRRGSPINAMTAKAPPATRLVQR